MAAKLCFIACVASLLNIAYSQCLGREAIIGPGLVGPFAGGWGYDGLGPYAAGWGYDGLGPYAGGWGYDGLGPFAGGWGYDGLSPFAGGWGYDGLGPFDALGYGGPWAGPYGPGFAGLGPATGLAAAYGGGLAITSASPIAPTGLSVNSENVIEGTLAVIGQLPFLGAVATDGAFPTVGAGAVSYGCGDGAIGIVAEAPIAAAPAMGPYGYGPGIGPYGYGCGCGGIY